MESASKLAQYCLDKVALLQCDLREHWNLVHMINQTAAGDLSDYTLYEITRATNTLVEMEVHLINMEDCLVMVRLGAILLDYITPSKEAELRSNIKAVMEIYDNCDRAREDLEQCLLLDMPVRHVVNLQERIKDRPELLDVLQPHVERMERNKANELLMTAHLIKKREMENQSVLWNLIVRDD